MKQENSPARAGIPALQGREDVNDQELRTRLADLLTEDLYDRGANVAQWPEDERTLHRELKKGHYDDYCAAIRRLRHEKAAAAILANPAVLDGICEYRARQINAERRGGTTWKSSADVPAGQRFRSVEFPNSVTWRRDVGGALAETPHGDGRIYPTSVVDRDWGDNGFEATPYQLGIADIERITAMSGFARAQMYREAAASVALDRGGDGTYSVGIPYPTPESDPDKPV